MAIYTLSLNFIDRVGENHSHLHNVFMKFPNPDCEHKAALDKSRKLYDIYVSASANNVDLLKWLEWMTHKNGTYFQVIDVKIPDNTPEEEIYLMVAAATKAYKKIIVDNHQCWQNFDYSNGTNKINYKGEEITILDKDEAYKELNHSQIPNFIQTMDKKNNPWQSGSFYVIAFVLIFAALVISACYLPIYTLPVTIIAAILAMSVIGALQLRNDDKLSDKSFFDLMKLSLKQLPLLRDTDEKKKQ